MSIGNIRIILTSFVIVVQAVCLYIEFTSDTLFAKFAISLITLMIWNSIGRLKKEILNVYQITKK